MILDNVPDMATAAEGIHSLGPRIASLSVTLNSRVISLSSTSSVGVVFPDGCRRRRFFLSCTNILISHLPFLPHSSSVSLRPRLRFLSPVVFNTLLVAFSSWVSLLAALLSCLVIGRSSLRRSLASLRFSNYGPCFLLLW